MSRWIVVSNRLPFSLNSNGEFVASSGGLVTAIGGVQPRQPVEKIWVGGAPSGLTEENWLNIKNGFDSTNWSYEPVFTDPEVYDLFYNRFCNDVLWPLLHYQNDLVHFSDQAWNAYVKINHQFAEALLHVLRPDDLIWIHDYHFFLLPELIKRYRPKQKIGFFLHVPFPSSEIFRQLPSREMILESLLRADLVGFHDYSYLHHFVSTTSRILGIDSHLLSIRHRNHTTRLGVFPVSIDTPHFKTRARTETIRRLESQYRKPGFVFLGVDRLDYIKGLDLKMQAFHNLLERYPEVHKRVHLLQVAVPTREGNLEFIRLHQEINRLVGEINGRFSTPDWVPIHYIHNSVSTDELFALYRSSDALLVTSKRDGMNLVALEYVATQSPARAGVVLLSEFTGALSILSHTIPINPWNIEDTSEKMKRAMDLPKEDKLNRYRLMSEYLDSYTATDWAQSFLSELSAISLAESQEPEVLQFEQNKIEELAREIVSQTRHPRFSLVLDYDGTLVPIEESPELARLPSATREILRDFARLPWLRILVLSGRDRHFLAEQFQGVPVCLGAEHGASFFDTRNQRWQRRVDSSTRNAWYSTALRILTHYTSRVPRSRIEKKQDSLTWHYRQSPQEYSGFMARKMAEELELGLANAPVMIMRGHKVIEVRSNQADKGIMAKWFCEQYFENSFALTFGDDRTDEDMFRATQDRGVSFRIGASDTTADYVLEFQAQVIPFISALLARIDRLMNTPPKRIELTTPNLAR